MIAVCAPDADVHSIAGTARREASVLLEAGQAAGIDVIRWDDEPYPPLLRAIADPPPVLWVRGVAAVLSRPAVAIVGSRAATPYALEVAENNG